MYNKKDAKQLICIPLSFVIQKEAECKTKSHIIKKQFRKESVNGRLCVTILDKKFWADACNQKLQATALKLSFIPIPF